MAKKSKTVIFDTNPGRNAQTYGIARELDTDMDLIHEPSIGVIGTKGDSQCYMGVQRKVEAIHDHLRARIGRGDGLVMMKAKWRFVWCSQNIQLRHQMASAMVRAKCATR